jgi:hypothetical protein
MSQSYGVTLFVSLNNHEISLSLFIKCVANACHWRWQRSSLPSWHARSIQKSTWSWETNTLLMETWRIFPYRRLSVKKVKKGQSILATGRGGLDVCKTSRLPHFLENRSQTAVRLSLIRGHALLPLRFLILISVRGWVDSGAIVRLEVLGQLQNPMTSWTETATFRFVAQCLNHYATIFFCNMF